MFKKIKSLFAEKDQAQTSTEKSSSESAHANNEKSANVSKKQLATAKSKKLKELYKHMAEVLNEAELRELILSLNIQPESLAGVKSKDSLSREFVFYLDRRNQVPILLDKLVEVYPQINWHEAEIIKAIDNYNNYRKNKSSSKKVQQTPVIDTPKPSNEPSDLRYSMQKFYNIPDLKNLVLDLGLDFDEIRSETKIEKIDSIIKTCEENDQTAQLEKYIETTRLQVTANLQPQTKSEKQIPSQTEESKTPQSSKEQAREQKLSLTKKLSMLNSQELIEVCKQIGVNYEDLAGLETRSKSRELVDYCDRRGALPELESAISKLDNSIRVTESVYDIHEIRELIFAIFADDSALTAFCKDTLPTSAREFGSGMSYRQKVQALMEYCALEPSRFEILLDGLRAQSQEAYTEHGPYKTAVSN